MHRFLVFLLMGKRDVDRFRLSHLHGGIRLRVETFLFDRNRISAGTDASEFSAAGEIGGSLERSDPDWVI